MENNKEYLKEYEVGAPYEKAYFITDAIQDEIRRGNLKITEQGLENLVNSILFELENNSENSIIKEHIEIYKENADEVDFEDAKSEGYEEGYEVGYDKGFDEGYNEAMSKNEE